jgi:RNA polymerase sigma-B factor
MGPEHPAGPDRHASGTLPPVLDPTEREELIEANLELATQLARRFMHRGKPYEDLVQVAFVALLESVDGYDPAGGVDFAPFASQIILGELKQSFQRKERGE